MDRVKDLYLLATTYTQDDIGQHIADASDECRVTCTVSSATRAEWYAVGQQDIRPEYVCKLAYDGDYQDEPAARLDGKIYDIYKTYLTKDGGIELYLKRREGDE